METDKVLTRELGKLGAIGGAIGGALGGGILAGIAGAIGGASGAYLSGRYLPTEVCTREIVLKRGATQALTVMFNALAGLGKIQERLEVDTTNPVISAVTGSGFMKLNPCLLTVEIVSYTENETTAIICGAAKEGLVKQRTAEKSVARLLRAIDAMAP